MRIKKKTGTNISIHIYADDGDDDEGHLECFSSKWKKSKNRLEIPNTEYYYREQQVHAPGYQ